MYVNKDVFKKTVVPSYDSSPTTEALRYINCIWTTAEYRLNQFLHTFEIIGLLLISLWHHKYAKSSDYK